MVRTFPTFFPKKKFSESPPIDAIRNIAIKIQIFKWYVGLAAKAAAANNNESPGRNGRITAPVSTKIMVNKMRYVHPPNVLTIFTKCESMCRTKSIRVPKVKFPFSNN